MTDETRLQFLDTNVLIYAYDRSAGVKHQRAKSLLAELWASGKGCVSVQVLEEFYVNVTRKITRPLEREVAKNIIADLGQWSTHTPQLEDVLEAIAIQQRYDLSFWDSLIITSATKLECEVIWSEDLNDNQLYDGVRVTNPFKAQP